MKESFYDYLDEFINYLQNIKNYSKLTSKTYYTPILKMIDISEIYEENESIIVDITKYRISISDQNPKTVNKKLSSIRSFIEFLKDKKLKMKLTGSQSIKSKQTLPKPVNTDNIYESLENASIEEKLIVLFIYSFGIRVSELCSLKLENINSDHITVLGKGNKQRQIPSNKIINGLFEEYKKIYNPKLYIFEKESKPLTVRQLQYRVEKVFKNIGIKATPHQLRHSFATDLLNEGARINDISQLLGHSSLKATGIYTKLTTNTKLKQYNMSHPLSMK
ncbi:MAG: tyrosine-type recombinase/integrase [Campylobacterota bacterium]|nr:tyrosine-type recombinase/integrase [Campylobacterota bacterium]